jgi:hypothetical protein
VLSSRIGARRVKPYCIGVCGASLAVVVGLCRNPSTFVGLRFGCVQGANASVRQVGLVKAAQRRRMDVGTLALGFVPVASVAIGAGATYAWQTLSNRRTEKAVRIQVNAYLLELTALMGNVYRKKWFPKDLVPTIQRLVAAFDNMEIALAFRDDPEVLWRLGQIRLQCEHIAAQNSEKLKETASDLESMEDMRHSLMLYAGTVLTIALQTFTDDRMRDLAVRIAADYRFSIEQHRVLAESQAANDALDAGGL